MGSTNLFLNIDIFFFKNFIIFLEKLITILPKVKWYKQNPINSPKIIKILNSPLFTTSINKNDNTPITAK